MISWLRVESIHKQLNSLLVDKIKLPGSTRVGRSPSSLQMSFTVGVDFRYRGKGSRCAGGILGLFHNPYWYGAVSCSVDCQHIYKRSVQFI